MNQFKKAKQLRMESGQTTESITDLKTAGVAQKDESQNYTETITSSNETKKEYNTSDVINEIPSVIQVETQTELPKKDIVEKERNEGIVLPKTNVISNVSQNNILTQPQESKILTATEAQPTELSMEKHTMPKPAPSITIESEEVQPLNLTSPESDAMQSPDTGSIIIPQATVPVNHVTSSISQPIVNSNSIQSSVQLANTTSAAIPTFQTSVAPIGVEYSDYQQNQAPKYQETSITKQNKTAKKSAPNIFAPKGEAKSMRKSLVLKPTSVKIAENYCSKNGGSFNELIQTLLDNFIDEYGL